MTEDFERIGPEGPRGPAGPPGGGLPAKTGPEGPRGPVGPPAKTGDRGPSGPIGDTGATGARGPEGLEGRPGDAHFVFTQGTATDHWVIVHGLNKFPSVLVLDTANSEIEGDIEQVNVNELKLTFAAPFSGVAYLN